MFLEGHDELHHIQRVEAQLFEVLREFEALVLALGRVSDDLHYLFLDLWEHESLRVEQKTGRLPEEQPLDTSHCFHYNMRFLFWQFFQIVFSASSKLTIKSSESSPRMDIRSQDQTLSFELFEGVMQVSQSQERVMSLSEERIELCQKYLEVESPSFDRNFMRKQHY